MKTLVWHGCYEKSLSGFIVPEAFSHPAKYSLSLIERVFDHMIERGWIEKGSTVGDPFGGVGVGGLVAAYRGLKWVGMELEPKFCTLAEFNFSFHHDRLKVLGATRPVMMQGDSRKFAERVAVIVSSPPYAQSLRGLNHNGIEPSKLDPTKHHTGKNSMLHQKQSYGSSPGQIEKLREGDIASVVSSPPYAETLNHGGGPDTDKDKTRGGGSLLAMKKGYGATEGQIGALKAVIASPPYAAISAGAGGLNTKPAKKPGQQGGRSAVSASQTANQKYGRTEGQISQLSAIATSPPWESNCEGGVRKGKLKSPPSSGNGNYGSPAARTAQLERDETKTYGDTDGNIGNTRKETYWGAMHTVYAQCFAAIRPGGHIAIVVKDYCKDGKIVPLCDDTARLLEHVGFKVIERAHAMLVNETIEGDLFNGTQTKRRERKSFFRRLYESKGGPRIDFEEVIFACKPKNL